MIIFDKFLTFATIKKPGYFKFSTSPFLLNTPFLLCHEKNKQTKPQTLMLLSVHHLTCIVSYIPPLNIFISAL